MSGNLFDIDAMMSQCAGKKEIAEAILDEFLSQTPKDLDELATTFGVGDLVALSKVAHRLKGTAGVLGAKEFHTHCMVLETACRNNEAAAVPGAYIAVLESAKACMDYVPTLRAELK